MKNLIIILLFALILAPASSAQRAKSKRVVLLQEPASLNDSSQKLTPPKSYEQRIADEIINFNGKVWIYAKNLDTGKDYALRADEQVRTASTIKFPIMVEVFHQIAEGKAGWTDEFTLTKQNKQGGSGILGEFSEGVKIDLKTATNLMIVVSDNTATNLILDKFGGDAVNARMDALGLKQTRSIGKIGGGGKSKAWDEPLYKLYGIGVSSPRDMVKLLEMLERGEVINKEASAEMIGILKRQQFTDGLGRNLLDTTPVASKSGAIDRLRSDVGIVYTRRGRIAMAITVDDMPVVHYSVDNAGNELIWRLSQILQEGLAK